MKFYLAGKISGNPNYKQDFAEAEKALREVLKNQWEISPILSPAFLPEGMTGADYMRICFAMVDSADCVILLPNATESEGAMLEKNYAEYIGKFVLHIDVKNKKVF